jgi:hypothetical protein
MHQGVSIILMGWVWVIVRAFRASVRVDAQDYSSVASELFFCFENDIPVANTGDHGGGRSNAVCHPTLPYFVT